MTIRIFVLLLALVAGACGRNDGLARAVYVLLDVSRSYQPMLPQALRSTRLVVTRLQPNDGITVARIEACSFSDQAILVRARLDDRPSAASATKRAVGAALDTLAAGLEPTAFTDVRGALYQAVQILRAAPQGKRYLVVFSDLAEDLPRDCRRGDLPGFDLTGIHVIAASVAKLDSDNRAPARYAERLAAWRAFALRHGAADWRVIDDPAALADFVAGRGPG